MVTKNPAFFKKARELSMKKYDSRRTTIRGLVEKDLTRRGRTEEVRGFNENLLYRVVSKSQVLKVLSRGYDSEGNLHCMTGDQIDNRGLMHNEALVVLDSSQLKQVAPGEYQFRDTSRKLNAVTAVYLPKYFRQ